MSRLEIRVTKWSDGFHWTVFDADPDYQSDRVEGVLVPWLIAEKRELTRWKALREAAGQAAQRFVPCGEMTVVVPLAVLGAHCVMEKVDRP